MKNHMKNNKKFLIGIGTVAAAGVVIICIGLAVRRGGKDSVVYRETAVEYGNLTVGITEEAAVEIGTLGQTFDLDISALVDSDTSSDNQTTGAMPFGGDMGGGAMGAGMMSFGSFDKPVAHSGAGKRGGRTGNQGGRCALYADSGKCGGNQGYAFRGHRGYQVGL